MNTNTALVGARRHCAGEQAILDAAVELFSRHGFDGVSMRTIAMQAGVSKSNIYHHFKSKEELYLEIMESSAERFSDMVEALAEGKGSFDQRLRVFARSHLEHLFDNRMTVRLMLREVFGGEEKWRRILVDQVVGGIFQRLITIFEKGQEQGLLRPGLDPSLCAMQLLGADLFYFQAYKMLRVFPDVGHALDRDRYSEEMMNIILDGMLVQPARGSTK